MQALANQPPCNALSVVVMTGLSWRLGARPLRLHRAVAKKRPEAEPITKFRGGHGLMLVDARLADAFYITAPVIYAGVIARRGSL